MKRLYLFIIVIILFAACHSGNEKTNTVEKVSLPIDKLNDSIARFPNNANLYYLRAKQHLLDKNISKAGDDIQHAIDLDSSKSEYYVTLSDVFFAMGQISNCRSSLEKALKLNQNNLEAVLKTAELHIYFKEYPRALEFLNRALKVDENNAKAYFMKGMVYKESGDTAKAITNFQIATEKDPDYYDSFMQLGLIFSARKNKLAVDYFKSALNIDPKSTEVYYALGLFYQNQGEINRAIETYTTLLKIDPNYAFAHYNLGYIHLVELRVNDMAIKHFTDAIIADPNFAEAYYNRGYTYELMGDVFNARKDYQVALKLRPQYQKAIEGLNRLDDLIRK